MTLYRSFEYLSEDGLRLFARDYHQQPNAPVLLCLHGLTRNSADFEPLCEALAEHYRLIVPDQRGRGRSANDPNPANYTPLQYNQDMYALLASLGIERINVIGTSMGGIMGMLMATEKPGLIASMVLNDIGPGIEIAGVKLIADIVSNPPRYNSWNNAVAAIAQTSGVLFPDYTLHDWQQFARRTCRETTAGIVPDYDPAIGQAFANADEIAAPDLWSSFAILKRLPMLVIRGAMSNILSAETCQRMSDEHPSLQVVELANRGHAPILDEPPALAAIEAFLERYAQ